MRNIRICNVKCYRHHHQIDVHMTSVKRKQNILDALATSSDMNKFDFNFIKLGVISVKHFAANQKRELSVILDRKRPGGPDDQLYGMSKSQKPISIGLHVIEAP